MCVGHAFQWRVLEYARVARTGQQAVSAGEKDPAQSDRNAATVTASLCGLVWCFPKLLHRLGPAPAMPALATLATLAAWVFMFLGGKADIPPKRIFLAIMWGPVASIILAATMDITELCLMWRLAGAGEVHTRLLMLLQWSVLILHQIFLLAWASFEGDAAKLSAAERAMLRTELEARSTELQAGREAETKTRKFMRYIFHEVRTPFNSLDMGLALLEDEESNNLSKDGRETLQRLTKACVSMRVIINDTLDWSKIESGTFQLVLGPTWMHEVLESTVHGMIPFAASPEHRVHLSCKVDSSLPACVLADGVRIQQVVANLVSNAIKFSPQDGTGRVTVSAHVLSSTDPSVHQRARSLLSNAWWKPVFLASHSTGTGGTTSQGGTTTTTVTSTSTDGAGPHYAVVQMAGVPHAQSAEDALVHELLSSLTAPQGTASTAQELAKEGISLDTPDCVLLIEVQDNGDGISKTDVPTLFQAFKQLDAGLQYRGKGTGLGLAICHEIVNMHGGRLGVRSTGIKGEDAAFLIALRHPVLQHSTFSVTTELSASDGTAASHQAVHASAAAPMSTSSAAGDEALILSTSTGGRGTYTALNVSAAIATALSVVIDVQEDLSLTARGGQASQRPSPRLGLINGNGHSSARRGYAVSLQERSRGYSHSSGTPPVSSGDSKHPLPSPVPPPSGGVAGAQASGGTPSFATPASAEPKGRTQTAASSSTSLGGRVLKGTSSSTFGSSTVSRDGPGAGGSSAPSSKSQPLQTIEDGDEVVQEVTDRSMTLLEYAPGPVTAFMLGRGMPGLLERGRRLHSRGVLAGPQQQVQVAVPQQQVQVSREEKGQGHNREESKGLPGQVAGSEDRDEVESDTLLPIRVSSLRVRTGHADSETVSSPMMPLPNGDRVATSTSAGDPGAVAGSFISINSFVSVPGVATGPKAGSTGPKAGSTGPKAGPVLRILVVDDATDNRKLLARCLKLKLGLAVAARQLGAYEAVEIDEAEDGDSAVQKVTGIPASEALALSLPARVPSNGSSSPADYVGDAQLSPRAGESIIIGTTNPAVQALAQGVQKYAVITMDAEMPRMSGYLAAPVLRSAGYTGLLYGCTGNALEHDQKLFMNAGVSRVFCKPIDVQALVRAIVQDIFDSQAIHVGP